jgi:3' terminal RNA ribose 2'-O-methyltransferase Hen1
LRTLEDAETSDLHEERLDFMLRHLLSSGAQRVLDLGCGSGELLLRLAQAKQFEEIIGVDISMEALAAARDRLVGCFGLRYERVQLFYASFAEKNEALKGFDAATLVETIEHIPPHELSAMEHAVFTCYRPKLVIVTTPNQDYNTLYGLGLGRLRHPEHYFEWSRLRFRHWANRVAKRNGYSVFFGEIGEPDPILGSPTQAARFLLTQPMKSH